MAQTVAQDRRQVADDSWAHIAVAGKVIIVRALNEILAFWFDGIH
jgi:hypothetical protein